MWCPDTLGWRGRVRDYGATAMAAKLREIANGVAIYIYMYICTETLALMFMRTDALGLYTRELLLRLSRNQAWSPAPSEL